MGHVKPTNWLSAWFQQFSPEQLTRHQFSGRSHRTSETIPAGEVRIGGFSDGNFTGGKSGLQNYLLQGTEFRYLINATHPYAAQISENALAAATELQIPFLRIDPSTLGEAT